MKKCTYCGKEVPDDVTVCPVDGNPVVDRAAPQKPTSNTSDQEVASVVPDEVRGLNRGRTLGVFLMLAAVIFPVVCFQRVFINAEAHVQNNGPDKRVFVLFEKNDFPGHMIFVKHDDAYTTLSNGVIRFKGGEIWEAKEGKATILWGNAWLVAKNQAVMIILSLSLFVVGLLMCTGKG